MLTHRPALQDTLSPAPPSSAPLTFTCVLSVSQCCELQQTTCNTIMKNLHYQMILLSAFPSPFLGAPATIHSCKQSVFAAGLSSSAQVGFLRLVRDLSECLCKAEQGAGSLHYTCSPIPLGLLPQSETTSPQMPPMATLSYAVHTCFQKFYHI